MEKLNKIVKDLIEDLILDVKDIGKEYAKTVVYEEMFKEYSDTLGFVKPREKTIVIYVSKYCPHCRNFLESPAFPLVIKKAKEKGFEVIVSRLNDEKSLDKALKHGLTNIPVAKIKYRGKEETLIVDEILNYLEKVK